MTFPAYPNYRDSGVNWLGALPSHWEVAPYKRLIEIRNGADYKHVEQSEGFPVIGSGGPFTFASDYLYDGESVLLGRKGTIDKPLHVTGRFWTVDTMYWSKIRPGISGRFAYYTATTIPFGYYSTNTALPSMTQSALNAHLVGLPPLPEQTAIAAFLDRETVKIDALVEEQRRLIELLKEKRQAVISHAVTKGLDPTVPTKDSGVEWLGQVPAHWWVAATKRVVSLVTSGPRGWSDLVSDDGSQFFQSQNIGRSMQVDLSDAKRIDVPVGPDANRAKLEAEDVVVCITGGRTGAVGFVGMLEEACYINQHVCLVRPTSDEIIGRFLAYILFSRVGQDQLNLSMYGLKQGLGLEDIREVWIAVPSLAEQRDIVTRLDALTGAIDELAAEGEVAISLLQEHRAALISAAVTGKIDVRGVSARQAEAA